MKAAKRTLRAEIILVAVVIVISCSTIFAIYKLYFGIPIATMLSPQSFTTDVAHEEVRPIPTQVEQNNPKNIVSRSVNQVGKLADSPIFDWTPYLNGEFNASNHSINSSTSIWHQNPTRDQLDNAKSLLKQSHRVSDATPLWLRPIENWTDFRLRTAKSGHINESTHENLREYTFPNDAKPTMAPGTTRSARIPTKPIMRPTQNLEDQDGSSMFADDMVKDDYDHWPSTLEPSDRIAAESHRDTDGRQSSNLFYNQHPLDDSRLAPSQFLDQFHDHQFDNQQHEQARSLHQDVQERPIVNSIDELHHEIGEDHEELGPTMQKLHAQPQNVQAIISRNMVHFDDNPTISESDKNKPPNVGATRLGQLLSQIMTPRSNHNIMIS